MLYVFILYFYEQVEFTLGKLFAGHTYRFNIKMKGDY